MAQEYPTRAARAKGRRFEWRVPDRFRAVEPRVKIIMTIHADGERAFKREVDGLKRGLLDEWERRLAVGVSVGREREAAAACLSVAQGFRPRSIQALMEDPDLLDLVERLDHIRAVTPRGAKPPAALVEALLGNRDGLIVEAPLAGDDVLSAVHAHDAEVNPRKSAPQIRVAVNRFIKVIGDKPMSEISPADAETLLIEMRRAALSRKREHNDPAHAIRRYFTSLKGIWTRWARRVNFDGRNPFSAVELDAPRAAQEGRLAFHRWHLSLITENARRRPATLAQLALMMRTGIGAHELAGLMPEDLYLEEEIPFIHIRDNARRALDKSGARARRVPIVGLSGDQVRAALVTDWCESSAGSLSKKLCAAIRSAGVPASSRLSCYSFRHSFKHALRAAAVPLVIQDRLMGHASESGAAASYGNRSARLAAKRDAIAAALPLLGDVDAYDYTPDELPLAVR